MCRKKSIEEKRRCDGRKGGLIGIVGNTFAPWRGSICNECGGGTTVNDLHTDCDDDCVFEINGNTYDANQLAMYPSPVPSLLFSLSRLFSVDVFRNGAVGPVYSDGFEYYFGLCSRNVLPSVCKGLGGGILNTHVCQVQQGGNNYALDAGWAPGYYALPNGINAVNDNLGFSLVYELGSLGCGPVTKGDNYPRSTNISFICDTTAGFGFPTLAAKVEEPYCNYNFVWRSLYACPRCNANFYDYYYTPCLAGSRQQVYYWKDPIVCYGGASLPAPVSVPCSGSTVPCGFGEILGPDGQTCVPCSGSNYLPLPIC